MGIGISVRTADWGPIQDGFTAFQTIVTLRSNWRSESCSWALVRAEQGLLPKLSWMTRRQRQVTNSSGRVSSGLMRWGPSCEEVSCW